MKASTALYSPTRHVPFAFGALVLAGLLIGPTVWGATALRGDFTDWDPGSNLTVDPDFGLGEYSFIMVPGVDGSPAEYKFYSTDGAVGYLGAGTSAGKNSTIGEARKEGGPNLTVTSSSSSIYTFRIHGYDDWWNRDYVVMETSDWPIHITSVSDNHEEQGADPVSVTLGLSDSKSTEEDIWVRFSRYSDFSSSTLIPATGSGTNYSATIPAQPTGTSIYYYVISSTMPSNVITANFDLCTLRGNNNDGSNYWYVVGDPEPVLGNSWHVPAEDDHIGVPMRNPLEPASVDEVWFYSGTYTTEHNQTSGRLHYRLAGGTWQSNSLAFDSNHSEVGNQYWATNIPGGAFSADDTVEYYFEIQYSNADVTWLGTTNNLYSERYAEQNDARNNPFSYTYEEAEPDLGNSWHHPGNAEPEGAFMRNPVQPFADQPVFLYNGNQFQGGPEAGDQSGGALFWREVGAGSWSSNSLSFDVEKVNNKYWVANIPADSYGGGDEVEYYFEITYSDRDTTYLGTTNNTASEVYASAAEAQAALFTFTYGADPGEGAGYMWHADNVVPLGDASAQFWVKIGYADGNGSNKWVDNVVLYYTTNNTAPSITGNGTAGADTFMQPLAFSHMEPDISESGDAMWWSGAIGDLPNDPGSIIRYQIGAWNSAYELNQRFADYQTAAGETEFSYSLYVAGASELQVSIDGGNSWMNADYTTSKAFIDEIAGDIVEVRARYQPGEGGVKNVEIFSNVGRRDYVNVDYTNQWISGNGYPDGIMPPDGNLLTTSDVASYFRAFPMTYNAGSGYYEWSTNVTKCGAYRLTARYQSAEQSGTNWTWYSSDGRRDHAIVLSPTKAHQLTMYEVNPLTIKATANNKDGRSTFADLLEGNPDSFTNFNLGYLNKLQVNTLWFQPIHPSAITTRGDPSGYEPGSPYATRDYFAVSKWFGRDDTEFGAMQEFIDFVAACDTNDMSVGTINIMLDGVFNHTAWDAIMGQGGVDLGFVADPNASMPGTRPGWYSYWQDYGEPATFYNDVYDNDIAVAPDRGDFGKWMDTADLFFGQYSALVRHNPENNSDYLNEGDVYDFAGMTTDTKDLWLYFGHYATFWLDQTGHPLTNTWDQATDDLGIDGLRCDFGQGLPPQFWEYFINHTRSMKWNFIFMAETLDGGIPGYRSNRHFDVLNEDILFTFHHDIDADTIRNAVEQRRNAYNGGTILLNQTSHDETMPSEDPWRTASYYGAVSTVDGIPMLFNGQEWGIRPAHGEWAGANTDWGFVHFELNFGKWIPHFKQWNKATFWETPPSLSDGLAQWHGRVNWARLNSPALQSMNRWFLNNTDGHSHSRIMSVAKYETPHAGPADSDVVLAFALVLDSPHAAADFTYDLKPSFDLLGLETGKHYNVRNLASSDASALLWAEPQSGQDLYDNGISIYFSAGTGEGNEITDDGALVQYLKVEEVGGPQEATSDSPAPVPYSWIDDFYPGEHSEQDYEDIAMQLASNGVMRIWETFVANIDPTDPDAVFKVDSADIETGVGNVISWSSAPNRLYSVWWTTNLLEEMGELQADIPSTPPLNVYTDTVNEVNMIFYRLTVDLEE